MCQEHSKKKRITLKMMSRSLPHWIRQAQHVQNMHEMVYEFEEDLEQLEREVYALKRMQLSHNANLKTMGAIYDYNMDSIQNIIGYFSPYYVLSAPPDDSEFSKDFRKIREKFDGIENEPAPEPDSYYQRRRNARGSRRPRRKKK